MNIIPLAGPALPLPRTVSASTEELHQLAAEAIANWDRHVPFMVFKLLPFGDLSGDVCVRPGPSTFVDMPLHGPYCMVYMAPGPHSSAMILTHELWHTLNLPDALPPGWLTDGYINPVIVDTAASGSYRGIALSTIVPQEQWFGADDIATLQHHFSPLIYRQYIPEVSTDAE